MDIPIGVSFYPKDDVDRLRYGLSALNSKKFIEYGHDEQGFPVYAFRGDSPFPGKRTEIPSSTSNKREI